MAKKRAGNVKKNKSGIVPPQANRGAAWVGAKLTEAEEDLLWHMEHGYVLETDSLGGDPALRRLKDDEVVRPASANHNSVKALEKRGLIVPGKGGDPLRLVWRPTKKS